MNQYHFETQILIPSLSGSLHNNTSFSIYKANENRLVLASDKFLNLFKLPRYDKLTNDIKDNFLNEHFSNQTIKLTRYIESKIDTLLELNINSDFLSICNYPNGGLKLLHALPICQPNGKFYGVKYNIIDKIPNCINISNIYREMEENNSEWIILDNKFNNTKFDFSEKETIILSMLISGYTQKEIAYQIGCSQPYIAKIIMQLAHKFGLKSHSARILINTAISLGYNGFMHR